MEKTPVQNQVHLEGAIKILTSDLVEEASRAGIDNQLQRWIEDLKALKALLHGGTYDGDQVGRLVHHLGTETTRVASLAEGNTRPHVEKLGAALLAAAGQLQGGNTSPEQDLKNNNRGIDDQA
jgi:hypothetical protein